MKAILVNTEGKIIGSIVIDERVEAISYKGKAYVPKCLSLATSLVPIVVFTECVPYLINELDEEFA
jgi:hypothetical protein